MECRDVDQLIDAWLDRELDAPTTDELSGHLAACARCRGQYASMVTLLTSPPSVSVPADLAERVMAAVEQSELNPTRLIRWPWHIWATAAAACIAFFIFGWITSQLYQPPGPAPIIVAKSDQPPHVRVVVSPWTLSSWAQTSKLPGPAAPMLFFAQAATQETIAAVTVDPPPVERCGPPVDSVLPPTEEPELNQLPIVLPVKPSLGV
jgi:hypothetical protein